MCVRTSLGAEPAEPVTALHRQNNKLQKAKEKYMKLHDELVARELDITEEQKAQAVFIPELADDILRASTINYSSLLKALSKYYEALQQTKFFKYVSFLFRIHSSRRNRGQVDRRCGSQTVSRYACFV